jgi:hypothetical protein
MYIFIGPFMWVLRILAPKYDIGTHGGVSMQLTRFSDYALSV